MSQNSSKKHTIALWVVCVLLWLRLSSMNSEMDEAKDQIAYLREDVEQMRILLEQSIEDSEESESRINASYQFREADVENGKVTVSFELKPLQVTENTVIKISNGIDAVEMTRENDRFYGVLEYPINEYEYETMAYVYEGDYEQMSECIDVIGSCHWANYMAKCEFEGFSAYGNGRLTLTGNMNYNLKVSDKVKSTEFVIGDKVIATETKTNGVIPLNVSEEIGDYYGEKGEFTDVCYVRIVLENGVEYCIYPWISESRLYMLKDDNEEREAYFIMQENKLVLKGNNGKIFQTHIYTE